MSEHEGLTYFDATKPVFNKPVKTDEETKHANIDRSLEDLIYEQKQSKRPKKPIEDRPKRSSRSERQVKHVTLRVPRTEITKLCESLNLNTDGYYVQVEAVLTKY